MIKVVDLLQLIMNTFQINNSDKKSWVALYMEKPDKLTF
jgi:hypothetical protein